MEFLIAGVISLIIGSCASTGDVPVGKTWTPIVQNKDNSPVKFYSRKNPYGEFSNFALFPIKVDGKLWGTSEHYYQAHKYDKKELQEYVRQAGSPEEAAKRGRDKNYPKRGNWKEVKDQIMYKALVAKYTQHQNLKELLLSTGNAPIIEHTKRDKYWGDAGDGSGLNKLGIMLVDIREKIKAGKL
ncbi:MAG: Swarming motility protein YbiA [Halobacteriovorax sp.]|nr:Swarming motility protein YbiA [Halobacteriovorax sp.]|tara:strand:+ start:213107 stop:213661 length:555 start_codon:yes stop_codon:yes gene_type:complete